MAISLIVLLCDMCANLHVLRAFFTIDMLGAAQTLNTSLTEKSSRFALDNLFADGPVFVVK